MKVAFLIIGGLEMASSRYRVLQYIPFLEKAGIEARVVVIPKLTLERWRLFKTLKNYDITFIQKKLFQPWELAYIKLMAHKLIYDLDDAVMYRTATGNYRRSFTRWLNFQTIARTSDLVIAGNSYIMGETRRYNNRVECLPTVIDAEMYKPNDNQAVAINDKIILGWIGSKPNLKYLKDIGKTLDRLFLKYHDVELKIVADDFIRLERMPVIEKRWRMEDEVTDLQGFDIGLMPLPDSPWARGKCGFKLLQYMALGLPVVCSPVGANKDIVKEGQNGFLANSPEEWYSKLSVLIEDFRLRKAMGRRGREILEEKYSLHHTAPRFIELLRTVYKS